MYSQPRERCDCGARVHKLYTYRFCGTAYARAYTDDVDNPSALWSEPGRRLRMDAGETSPLLPLDMLLESPSPARQVEHADSDLETGRINPNQLGHRVRTVYLRNDHTTLPVDDDGDVDQSLEARGQFIPCGCCGKVAQFGRTTVQDHQTKGDQPFQAIVAKQIQIQPPNANKPSRFAPLRGPKVLVFSDSRQVAARLAPNLQMYSMSLNAGRPRCHADSRGKSTVRRSSPETGPGKTNFSADSHRDTGPPLLELVPRQVIHNLRGNSSA